MSDLRMTLLSELSATTNFVDDDIFTEVSDDGERYTTYRIIRVTHTIAPNDESWTHLANVALLDGSAIAVALLNVRDRIVEDSRVCRSGPKV